MIFFPRFTDSKLLNDNDMRLRENVPNAKTKDSNALSAHQN